MSSISSLTYQKLYWATKMVLGNENGPGQTKMVLGNENGPGQKTTLGNKNGPGQQK